jgi:hypothetical protein
MKGCFQTMVEDGSKVNFCTCDTNNCNNAAQGIAGQAKIDLGKYGI